VEVYYQEVATGKLKEYMFFDRSKATAKCAVLERVFYVKDPDTGAFRPPRACQPVIPRLGYLRDAIVARMPTFTPQSIEEFVETYRGGPKYAVYKRAAKSLRENPLT